MIIIENKNTKYHICYSKDASECVRYSSTELQKYLYKNSFINIPIVDYFTLGNKSELLNCIDLSANNLKDYRLIYNLFIFVSY